MEEKKQTVEMTVEENQEYEAFKATQAEKKAKETGDLKFMRVAENCRAVAWDKPKTLYQKSNPLLRKMILLLKTKKQL